MNAKKILFATDFSAASETALALASSLASDAGAVLHLAHSHVGTPYPIGTDAYGISVDSPIHDAERRAREKKLTEVRPTIEGVECMHHGLEGMPAEEIIELSEKEAVDLIVVGSHGRTGLSRMLMGSVAEAIVRHAKCPVVVVKHAANLDQELASDA